MFLLVFYRLLLILPVYFSPSGHFVYLEATPVGLKGDKARMRSSVWKESSATCKLSFWYYISHMSLGTIRVLVKVNSQNMHLLTHEATL